VVAIDVANTHLIVNTLDSQSVVHETDTSIVLSKAEAYMASNDVIDQNENNHLTPVEHNESLMRPKTMLPATLTDKTPDPVVAVNEYVHDAVEQSATHVTLQAEETLSPPLTPVIAPIELHETIAPSETPETTFVVSHGDPIASAYNNIDMVAIPTHLDVQTKSHYEPSVAEVKHTTNNQDCACTNSKDEPVVEQAFEHQKHVAENILTSSIPPIESTTDQKQVGSVNIIAQDTVTHKTLIEHNTPIVNDRCSDDPVVNSVDLHKGQG